jgi:GNAT superfamily N-acetyltransferase
MNVQLERIQSDAHRFLDELLPLYSASFPPEERRDLDVLLKMMPEAQMFFSAVVSASHLAGLVVYWEFDGFLYVEHLALFLPQRGKGIGREVLNQLQRRGNPILLEVEIPFDDVSTNRVAFYYRCGFQPLPIDYLQPPYREGETLLPMMLFSDQMDWDAALLKRSVELFQYRVYGYGRYVK